MGMILNPFAFSVASLIPTNNLFLWLKPDSGISADTSNRVSKWADSSGNHIDFTSPFVGQQPIMSANTFNGYSGVEFSGGTQGLSGGNTSTFNFMHGNPNSGHTMFWVWRVQQGQANNFLGAFVNTNAGGAGAVGYYSSWETSSPSNINEIESIIFNGGGGTPLRINTGNNTYWPGVLIRGQDFVSGWTATGVDRTLSESGSTKGTANTALVPSSGNAEYLMSIGCRPTGTQPFKGFLVELIIYNRGLGQADQDTVNGYLKTKYSIA